MEKTITFCAALLVVALQVSRPGIAADSGVQFAGDLKLEQPWTRATPPNAPGGAYLTITNTGAAPDRLVSVSSPLAGKAEIHEMKMNDGVMSMRPLNDGLPIPPGETTLLKPGGFHIMLMKLERPIKKGETVPITLRFERAGEVVIKFMAAPIGAKKPHDNHGGSGG